MKLVDIVNLFEDFDEEAVIFQKDLQDPFSDILIASPMDGDEGVKNCNNQNYYYLIEVFLAKEFVNDLKDQYMNMITEDLAKKLHSYAIYDA